MYARWPIQASIGASNSDDIEPCQARRIDIQVEVADLCYQEFASKDAGDKSDGSRGKIKHVNKEQSKNLTTSIAESQILPALRKTVKTDR